MLEIRQINFAYGSREVLSDVSFNVPSGGVTVLTGANGAGKTTLLEILAGIRLPRRGTVRLEGFDAFAEPLRYRRLVGYAGEQLVPDSDFTVKGYLKYRAKLKGEQSRKVRHRVHEAMEACALTDLAGARAARLSLGARRRLALAEALLLRPRVLLADDVFAGLDGASRTALGPVLTNLAQFASVLVSGHELAQFGTFATRFAVLKEGRAQVVGTAAEAEALQ